MISVAFKLLIALQVVLGAQREYCTEDQHEKYSVVVETCYSAVKTHSTPSNCCVRGGYCVALLEETYIPDCWINEHLNTRNVMNVALEVCSTESLLQDSSLSLDGQKEPIDVVSSDTKMSESKAKEKRDDDDETTAGGGKDSTDGQAKDSSIAPTDSNQGNHHHMDTLLTVLAVGLVYWAI